MNPKEAAAQAAAARVSKAAKANAPEVTMRSGAELVATRKIGLVGNSGAGKTYFLKAALLAGCNIAVMSTDLGGNGLATLEGEARVLGCLDRFHKQVRGFDFTESSKVMGYVAGAYNDLLCADGWSPDVEMWDGFSTFNQVTADREVGEPRSQSGEEDKYAYFRKVARKTLHPLELFFAREVGGKRPHKIVTFAADDVKDETGKPTGVIKAMIQGKANKISKLGFDLVLYLYTTKSKVLEGGKATFQTVYKYRTGGASDKFPVMKNRGFDLPEIMDADPCVVWEVLTGQKPVEGEGE